MIYQVLPTAAKMPADVAATIPKVPNRLRSPSGRQTAHATDEGSRNDDRHFGGERVGRVHEQPQHKPNSQEQQNSCTSDTEPEMTGVLLDSLPVLWLGLQFLLGPDLRTDPRGGFASATSQSIYHGWRVGAAVS